jgi:hypothetical protein
VPSHSVPRCLVAQDVRQEGHESSERGDVSDPPGSDVLDPADHPSREVRVRVEVQYERPVGWQLEHDEAAGRVPP